MRLSKNFVIIGTTALIVSAIFIIYILFFVDSGPKLSFTSSEIIPWNKADSLKKEYKKFNPKRLIHNGRSGNDPDNRDTLEGFVFEAADIDSIINRNRSASGNPDKIIFYLGQNGSRNYGATKYGNWNLIAVGIKDNKLLTDSAGTKEAAAASVYDRADPCPPFCPE